MYLHMCRQSSVQWHFWKFIMCSTWWVIYRECWLNHLMTDGLKICHMTLTACCQLAQSILKVTFNSKEGLDRGRWVGVTLQVTVLGGCCGWLLLEYRHAFQTSSYLHSILSKHLLLSEHTSLATLYTLGLLRNEWHFKLGVVLHANYQQLSWLLDVDNYCCTKRVKHKTKVIATKTTS